MNQIVTKELIFSYFMGNASAIQRQTIAQWAGERANEEQLYRWLEEFETLHPEYDANLENAIHKYYTFLSEQSGCSGVGTPIEEKIDFPPSLRWSLWLKWGIAAGIVILLGFSVFFSTDGWQYKTYSTEIGERKDFTLPDGSEVSLSANSSLKIPRRGFGSESRDVYLAGEAFFNVKHTFDHKRFVVKTTKRFEVEVLGTEFNVVARETGSRVILRKGKVQLSFQAGDTGSKAEDHKMDLKPGDVFTLDSKNNTSLTTTTLPEIREAWQGHLYIFDKTSLSEIMGQLREYHGVKVEFADRELAEHTISGKFTAENIDELFELIQGILDIKITRRGDNVIISRPH